MSERLQRAVLSWACWHAQAPFDPWLSHLTLTEAVLACIGAGPWKIGRRQTVQQRAIDRARGRDLSEIRLENRWFPLLWQQQALARLIRLSRDQGDTAEAIGGLAVAANDHGTSFQAEIAAVLQTNWLKCWSLLARDRLGLPAFPVDRHVRRWLQKEGLPLTEREILDLYREVRYREPQVPSISSLNRAIVAKGFTGNPRLETWSGR